MEEINVPWWQWCRLCAKEDQVSNVNISNEMNIATSIGKYFWVNIRPTDQCQQICQDCLRLINQLVKFTDRVNKVQAMFCMLENVKKSEDIDPHELRLQYNLLEDDFEPIAKVKSPKQEPFFNEDSILGFEESDHEQENHFDEIIPCQGDDKRPFKQNEISSEELKKKKHHESQENNKLKATDSFEEAKVTNDNEETTYATCGQESNQYNEKKDILERQHEDNETVSSSTSENKLTIEPRYKCRICGKTYKNATSFRKHMSQIHKIEPDIPDFKCEKCDKIFPTVRQLLAHNRIHLPLELKLDVQCQQCNKKFSTEAVMKQHMSSVHRNDKTFMCEECGLGLASLASYNDHKITHSNDFPYECDICRKKLNTKRTLKMHMLVHSEERNYKCNFCSAKFKRGKALKNHLILHLGLRPYKCKFCQKTFTNGSNCRSHKKRFHSAALAEEEAAGHKTEPIRVPKISELRARSDIKGKSPISRKHSGLSPKRRLIAAEERQTDNETEKVIKNKIVNPRESFTLEDGHDDIYLVMESDDETCNIEGLEEGEEAVVYEVIE